MSPNDKQIRFYLYGIQMNDLNNINIFMKISEILDESWSKKYKRSIDCNRPAGFSQRAHCAARKLRRSGKKTRSSSVKEARNEAF